MVTSRFFRSSVLSAVVFFGTAALYISTAPPDLIFDGGLSGDSAELQRVAYRLGIAHSTGYPLWTLLAHAAARTGEALGGSPYAWVTYTSGLFSAATLALFFQAACHVGRLLPALFATLVLAAADSVWHLSTIAEVQALHAFVTAGVLWLVLIHLRYPGRSWPLAGTALLLGIGLANHRTIVLLLPMIGLAMLLTGRWRRLRVREGLGYVLLAALPLLSYGYLYWRATDPQVVFSTRPTWFPAEMTPQMVTALIQGTFQDGQSLTNNLDLSLATLPDHLADVLRRLAADVSWWAVGVGGLGLGLLLRHRQAGAVLGIFTLTHIGFLMAWLFGAPKAPIYQFPALMGLALGMVSFVTALIDHLSAGRWLRGALPLRLLVRAALPLPILVLAVLLYAEHRPLRDFSQDTRTANYRAALDHLPDDAVLYTGIWQPETFITLEYLDTTGRRSPLPAGTDLWWVPLDPINDTTQPVFIGLSWRSGYGLYAGATWFQQEHNIAFSGTGTDFFLQAHPTDDPRLLQEAAAAQRVEHAMTPEIDLYSYRVEREVDGFHITLYWRARDEGAPDYAVYTHLRTYGVVCDADTVTALLAQDDSSAPVEGAMPTHIWQAGQVVRDTYFIPWVGDTPPGAALVFGLTRDGQRVGEFCVR